MIFGTINAARMPMIAITTMTSIKVKPPCRRLAVWGPTDRRRRRGAERGPDKRAETTPENRGEDERDDERDDEEDDEVENVIRISRDTCMLCLCSMKTFKIPVMNR